MQFEPILWRGSGRRGLPGARKILAAGMRASKGRAKLDPRVKHSPKPIILLEKTVRAGHSNGGRSRYWIRLFEARFKNCQTLDQKVK
jgi:hypothetical protein